MDDKRLSQLNSKIKKRNLYDRGGVIFKAILLALMVLALALCGIYYYKKTSQKSQETSIQTPPAGVMDDVSAKASEETKEYHTMLSDLKEEYINTFEEKYPSADVSFLIKDLDRDITVVSNLKQMNSASVIKLFIMETVYKRVASGDYTLTEEGKNHLRVMITQSNNNAANYFIDEFGGEDDTRKVKEDNYINTTIASSGYKHTEANRKMHDTTPPEGPSGYENYTGVEDVAALLEGIYNKTLFEEPYNTEALELLKKQERTNKIPALISEKYPHVVVANKTGELSQVENDAALIFGKDYNLILVIMVNEIPKTEDGSTDYDLKEKVQQTISELALKLVESYEEKSSSKTTDTK